MWKLVSFLPYREEPRCLRNEVRIHEFALAQIIKWGEKEGNTPHCSRNDGIRKLPFHNHRRDRVPTIVNLRA